MDLASRFNETGVRLYHQGRGDEAFDMFSASLQVMLQTAGRTTDQMDTTSCQLLALHEAVQRALSKDQSLRQRQSVEELFNQNQNVSSRLSSSNQCGQSNSLSEVECDRLSVNQRSQQHPVSISSEQDPCLFTKVFSLSGTYNYDYHQFIVAVATDLYNMALILQRGQVMSRMSNCLERALVLYSFAGELLWNNIGYGMLMTNTPGGILLSKLYCGILNNSGYLLHQMAHFDWSQIFFERLYQFLELLGPTSDEVEQRERDTFQLNVVVLYRTLTTAAAA